MDGYGKVTVIERDEPTANRFRIDRGQHLTIFPSRSPCLTMDSYGKVTLIERDKPTENRFRIDRGQQHVDLHPQDHSTPHLPYRRSHYVKENRELFQKHGSATSDNVSYVRFMLSFSLDFLWFLVFKRFGAFGAGEAKYPFPQKPQVLELRKSHGECEEFSESGLSDGRGDFEGSVDSSEELTKRDYGRISESSSQFCALPLPAQAAIDHDFTHSLSRPQCHPRLPFRNPLPRLPGFGWPVF